MNIASYGLNYGNNVSSTFGIPNVNADALTSGLMPMTLSTIAAERGWHLNLGLQLRPDIGTRSDPNQTAEQIRLSQGATADEAKARIGQVVEGLVTAPVLRDLSYRIGVELPITEGVCAILEGMPLQELADSLMGRRPTEE